MCPQPGPAAEESRAQGPASRRALAGHRGTGDQPPPLPPAQGPLPAPRGLTQETTRPLKQGSLALSSEISSFTTLQADAAVRPLQWGPAQHWALDEGPQLVWGAGHTGRPATRADVSLCGCPHPAPPFPGTFTTLPRAPSRVQVQGDPDTPSTKGHCLNGPKMRVSALLCASVPPRPVHGEGRAHPASLEQGLVHSRPQHRCGQVERAQHTDRHAHTPRAGGRPPGPSAQPGRQKQTPTHGTSPTRDLEGQPSSGPAGATEKPQALEGSERHQPYHCPAASPGLSLNAAPNQGDLGWGGRGRSPRARQC